MNKVVKSHNSLKERSTETLSARDSEFTSFSFEYVPETSSPSQLQNSTLDENNVLSIPLKPIEFNPLPYSKEASAIFLVSFDTKIGFTAERIESLKITQTSHIQAIRATWNEQAIQFLWQQLVSHRCLEEELVACCGFIVVVRKGLIKAAADSKETKEVWNTTVWSKTNGSIKAIHQYVSTAEPTPVQFKTADGESKLAYQLSPENIIVPNEMENCFDFIDLEESGGIIVDAKQMLAMAA